MTKLKSFTSFLTTILVLFLSDSAQSCSMYKISMNGKTMLGSNYDAYYLTTRIWFENGTKTGDYGAVFTGGRIDRENKIAPQSGMNEFGLAFTQAAVHSKELTGITNRKTISNITTYFKDILHKCRTVEEVKDYINQYDHSNFSAVFLYTDKSGKYLIVEPDTIIEGNDPKYVLSNFCPSQTPDLSIIKMKKYTNGIAFLKNKIDTTIGFCTALSDTMHVCRKKIGDGTLLTSIWDVNAGITYLYFYHDYKHLVQFNLKDELAKGNHALEIPTLFPPNAEYEKLIDFKIPQNSSAIQLFFIFCGGLFLFSSIFFIISFFRNRKAQKGIKNHFNKIKVLLSLMSTILLYYIFVLATNELIFYYPAPYKDATFSLLNIAAYIPFLILLLTVLLLRINLKIFKENAWSNFSKWIFAINNLTYLTLIILFAYWGLFNIFS